MTCLWKLMDEKCEIEWNIAYEKEFCNIMSFKVEAKCKRALKKRP